MTIQQTFAKNIFFLRKLYGFNQDDFIGLLGFSRGRWASFESVGIEPNLETLIAISDFFGVTLDALLREDISNNLELAVKLNARSKQDLIDRKPEPVHYALHVAANILMVDLQKKLKDLMVIIERLTNQKV